MIAEVGICTGELARSVGFWSACFDVDAPDPDPAQPAGSVVLPGPEHRGRVRLFPVDPGTARELAANPQPTGWRAAEVLVDDLASTFRRVQRYARRVLGPPRWLGDRPEQGIRAAQLVAPGGEVVYLTEVDEARFRYRLPADRRTAAVFIMVLGTWHLAGSVDHYRRHGFPLLHHGRAVITSLNLLQHTPGADTESAFHDAGDGTFLELNEYQGSRTPAGRGPIAYVLQQSPDAAAPVRVGPDAELLVSGPPAWPVDSAPSRES